MIDKLLYRMPAAFGPTSGPRQHPPGVKYDAARFPVKTTAFAVFEASAKKLEKLVSPTFKLREACVHVEFTYMTELDWLAGRGYNFVAIRVPVSIRNDNDKIQDGLFQPVIWENLTEPIISGREELGYNKIFCNIPAMRVCGETNTCSADWDGFRFMELTLSNLEMNGQLQRTAQPVFHHKIFPKTEAWGELDVDSITVTPASNPELTKLGHSVGTAKLSISRPRWEDMPTQYQIVNTLESLEFGACTSAGLIHAKGSKDLSDQIVVRKNANSVLPGYSEY